MAGLAVYRQLLSNRPLTKLLIGEFISGIGDWLYIVAIFVVIYTQTNDAALLGIFGAVRLFPYILLSIPAGFVADRFERRLVLLASDAFRGSIMILLTVLVIVKAPIVLIAALAIVAAGGSAFFYPAMGAYMPSLVRDERELVVGREIICDHEAIRRRHLHRPPAGLAAEHAGGGRLRGYLAGGSTSLCSTA